MKRNYLLTWAAIAALPMLLASSASAQFDSGSDGSDGPLVVNTNMTLPVQADGVHHYTTITVAGGATLTFQRNALNTRR